MKPKATEQNISLHEILQILKYGLIIYLKMEKINLKRLTESILKVCAKAPITYINDSIIIFRGQRLNIKEDKAKSLYFEFTFTTHQNFIKNLRNYGLMLSQLEYYKIIQEYGSENTK